MNNIIIYAIFQSKLIQPTVLLIVKEITNNNIIII